MQCCNFHRDYASELDAVIAGGSMKDEGKLQSVARDHWCDLRDEIRRARRKRRCMKFRRERRLLWGRTERFCSVPEFATDLQRRLATGVGL
jgi:hypothetical protein